MEGKLCVISCDCKPSVIIRFLVSTCVGYTFARCYSHKHNKEISDWHNFRNTVGVPKSQVLQKEMEGKQSIRWEIHYMSNQVQLFTNRLYKSKAPATSTCFTSKQVFSLFQQVCFLPSKGQLISECLLSVIDFPKNLRKI